MNEKMFLKVRLYFTAIVTIAIWSLLVWGYYHGGVPSHHVMARADMPEISNWWGGVLLPLLTWFLLYRVKKRIVNNKDKTLQVKEFSINALYGLVGALLFGILLSTFFTFGYSDLQGYMLYGLFLLALFLPIYRAECILGFVIGMSFTFGAVLPTVAGSVLALIGAVIYILIRPTILFIISSFTRIISPNKYKTDK